MSGRDFRRALWHDLKSAERFVVIMQNGDGPEAQLSIHHDGMPDDNAERVVASMCMKAVTYLYSKHSDRGGTQENFLPHADEIPGFPGGTPKVPEPRISVAYYDGAETEDGGPGRFVMMAEEYTTRGKVDRSCEIVIPSEIYVNRDLDAFRTFVMGSAIEKIAKHLGWPNMMVARKMREEVLPQMEAAWEGE